MRVEVLLAALLGLSVACAGSEPPPPAPPAAEPALTPVREDLDALRGRLLLPDGAVSARWATAPLGVQGGWAPGPTDLRLVAWVEIDPARWDTVEAVYGEPRPPRGALSLSADELGLLPEAARPPPGADGEVRLEGQEYRPDRAARAGWGVSSVRRVGDAGLWIVATSI